jgi:hypothetical protein
MLLGVLPQFFLNPSPPRFSSEDLLVEIIISLVLALTLAIPRYLKIATLSNVKRELFWILWVLVVGVILIGMVITCVSFSFFLMFIAILFALLVIGWIILNVLIRRVIGSYFETRFFSLLIWYLTVFIFLNTVYMSLILSSIDPFIYTVCLLVPIHAVLYICSHMNRIGRKKLVFIVVVTVLCVGLMVHILKIRADDYSRYRSSMEERARSILKGIGSTQTSFYEKNNRYGSWDELREQKFIPQQFIRAGIIYDYSICLFEANNGTTGSGSGDIVEPSFTIIAVPNQPELYKIRTFAICEDQIIRRWRGNSDEFDLKNINMHNRRYWKPLR